MGCIVRVNQLRQAQGTRHTGRPAADNNHIRGHLRPLNAFDWFAENQHKKTSATDLHGSSRIRPNDLIRENRWESVADQLPAFAFFTSSINGGTMSNKFPTIA